VAILDTLLDPKSGKIRAGLHATYRRSHHFEKKAAAASVFE